MRIVKRGKLKEEKFWLGTCHNCKSVVEARRHEVNVEWDSREQSEFGRSNCPVCKHSMVFYEKEEG